MSSSSLTVPSRTASSSSSNTFSKPSASGSLKVRSSPIQRPAPATTTTNVVTIASATSVGTAPKIAFISGHIDHPPDYFTLHYESRINEAIQAGHSFVLGAARGIDSLSLAYLLSHGVAPSRITIFITSFQQSLLQKRLRRYVTMGVTVKVEGASMTEKDAAMTRESDYDILKYMSEDEQKMIFGERYRRRTSGTEKNEIRRAELEREKSKKVRSIPGMQVGRRISS